MKKTKLLLAMVPFITSAHAAEETVIQDTDLLFYIVPNATAKAAADNSAVASEMATSLTRYVPIITTTSVSPSVATRHPVKHHHKRHAVKRKVSAPAVNTRNTPIPATLTPAGSAAQPCIPAAPEREPIFLRIMK